ncbi:hypothetical protein BDV27DRAFT_126573, partial [Aspergillus caelatus]
MGYETDRAEFVLYKNTRFQECTSIAPDADNCSEIETAWKHSTRYTRLGAQDRWHILWASLGPYDWCQIASCFHEYKVIPSMPRSSAMSLTTFQSWCYMAMSSLGAMWAFKSWWPGVRSKKSASEPCKGLRELGVLNWGFLIWDICGPTIFWWVSFVRELVEPVPITTLSTIAWATCWKYSYLVRYHPYSCFLARFPRVERALPWVLGTMATLQWTVTLYSARV